MNENLDRIRHGWQPRADAHWIWWIINDMIMMKYIIEWAMQRKFKIPKT